MSEEYKEAPDEISCGDSAPEHAVEAHRDGKEGAFKSDETKNRLIILVAAAFAIFLSVFALWPSGSKTFPLMPPGEYLGVVKGAFSSATPIYAEIVEGGGSIFIIPLREGFAPQTVNLSKIGENAPSFSPIVIEGKSARLTLAGDNLGSDKFGGTAFETKSGNEGTWELLKINSSEEADDASKVADIRLWLVLRGELFDVDQKILKVQSRIPELETEISKLSQFITDDKSLKDNAGRKLFIEREILSKLRAQLKSQQEEVAKLERQVDLSHRVTAMGKLVSLSRESLEREGRWIASALRSGTGDLAPELEEAALRGEKIFELKKRIEVENGRIYALLNPNKSDEKEVSTKEDSEREDIDTPKKKSKSFWGSLFGGDDDE